MKIFLYVIIVLAFCSITSYVQGVTFYNDVAFTIFTFVFLYFAKMIDLISEMHDRKCLFRDSWRFHNPIKSEQKTELFLSKKPLDYNYEGLFSPELAKKIRETLQLGEDLKADIEKYKNTKGIK